MTTVPLPSYTDGVDLRYFIEPLTGPKDPRNYLDRFPDALYNKSLNSRFVRFMYVLLGPAGVGWLRLDLLYARLQLEAQGAQLFDLERFYGDPFSFGRILTESFDDDITGLLPAAVWDRIRMQDEAYRTRAILFMNAARLGGTPAGMTLAASSGIGQDAEVIENYKFLFDDHSDDPLGLPFLGSSTSLGEFIIRPRPATSRSSVQTIRFDQSSVALGSNDWYLSYRGLLTTPLSATADAVAVQLALEALANNNVPLIGPGNVLVSGGPAPDDLTITFAGALSNQDVPTLVATFDPPGFTAPVAIPVTVIIDGISPSGEVATIAPADQHHMQAAIDYLRPVGTYPSFINGRSHLLRQEPTTTSSSSQLIQVIRYVSGNPAVSWPTVDNVHWIAASQENESPRLNDARHQHYVNFHNVAAVSAYTDAALADPEYSTNAAVTVSYPSLHIGGFDSQVSVMPFLTAYAGDTNTIFSPDKALPDYAEFLSVTQQTSDGIAFINDVYPADYLNLQGAPAIKYNFDHFWSSAARTSGAEILEIDLGCAQAVNYVTFEITRKPLRISVDYDLADQAPGRRFMPVSWLDTGGLANGQMFYDPTQQNPWEEVVVHCQDPIGDLLFTRFVRLTFTRRASNLATAFLYDPSTEVQTPWTVEVRNLRIGRNLAPA